MGGSWVRDDPPCIHIIYTYFYTVLNLYCSRTQANGITALTQQLRYIDLRLFVGISSKSKEHYDQLLGNTKKLCHGCNRTFESFSSKHLMGFLSSCLVVIYWFHESQGSAVMRPPCSTHRLFVWWRENAQVWLVKNSCNACVCQKPCSSSPRHGGYAGELDILNPLSPKGSPFDK